jgi:hypothetical protein
MVDVLTVLCPRCKHPVEFIRKGSECATASYELGDCPVSVLEDVIWDEEPCNQCGAVIGFGIHNGLGARVTNHMAVW